MIVLGIGTSVLLALLLLPTAFAVGAVLSLRAGRAAWLVHAVAMISMAYSPILYLQLIALRDGTEPGPGDGMPLLMLLPLAALALLLYSAGLAVRLYTSSRLKG